MSFQSNCALSAVLHAGGARKAYVLCLPPVAALLSYPLYIRRVGWGVGGSKYEGVGV